MSRKSFQCFHGKVVLNFDSFRHANHADVEAGASEAAAASPARVAQRTEAHPSYSSGGNLPSGTVPAAPLLPHTVLYSRFALFFHAKGGS